jgi:hypothetical protein
MLAEEKSYTAGSLVLAESPARTKPLARRTLRVYKPETLVES